MSSSPMRTKFIAAHNNGLSLKREGMNQGVHVPSSSKMGVDSNTTLKESLVDVPVHVRRFKIARDRWRIRSPFSGAHTSSSNSWCERPRSKKSYGQQHGYEQRVTGKDENATGPYDTCFERANVR